MVDELKLADLRVDKKMSSGRMLETWGRDGKSLSPMDDMKRQQPENQEILDICKSLLLNAHEKRSA